MSTEVCSQAAWLPFAQRGLMMKVYDISQEVLSCTVYPGDPVPQRMILQSMERGDLYNLSAFQMCAHNGTHIDAPAHFLKDGLTVDALSLDALVGMAYVVRHEGIVSADDAAAFLSKARAALGDCAQRLLIKGEAVVSQEAAQVFAQAKLLLVGNESQSVGPEDAPMAVHKTLLGSGVVLLEGIRLSQVPEGKYLLSAAPLNIVGAEGSPCRAVLIDLGE